MPKIAALAVPLLALFVGCGNPEVPHAGPDAGADGGELDPGAGLPDAGPVDAGPPPGFTLEVTVAAARDPTGRTCLAIFDDAAAFPSNAGRAVFNQCFDSIAGPHRVQGLVDGHTYGLSIFHDANANSALDTQKVLGLDVPKEGIGFSNDPAIGFGPPTWDQVKFVFDAAHRSMLIKLTYLL